LIIDTKRYKNVGWNKKMRFRPCIDIHNGKVKQIVGGSHLDAGDQAKENFASEQDSTFYADLYRKDGLKGGHIILLNPSTSEYYEATRQQALNALAVYAGGMQIGGGITASNAKEYIDAGASHVIVTSYVFSDGKIKWENLKNLVQAVGKEHVVLDLSCRKKGEDYYIVTNRWQTFTETKLEAEVLVELSGYCDEFLVHGVDVEGKSAGVDKELVSVLNEAMLLDEDIVITYAGGIGSMEDLEAFAKVADGQATTILLPSELQGIASIAATLKETAK
jgi:phosphoribosylformimino-5-aminoimidazole carboxamide ribotide isomerase